MNLPSSASLADSKLEEKEKSNHNSFVIQPHNNQRNNSKGTKKSQRSNSG